MKANIGTYVTWWGPYQVADLLQKIGVHEDDCRNIGKWLSKTWVNDVLVWIYSKRKRKISVRVDYHDVWNAHETIAFIVLPILQKLKEVKHGDPFTDDEDVPEHLRSTNAPAKENEWDTDDLHSARWNWILDEMIWTFEQETIDWEAQFHSGVADIYFEELEDNPNLFEMKRTEKDTWKYDDVGANAHRERMKNGRILFAKYYHSLWD